MDELYKVERPKTFKQVVGNADVKSQLIKWLKKDAVPHFILFTGGSGMGKTTLARILRDKLDCGPMDFQEINAAGEARGIDKIKKIESQVGLAPISGSCRIYLIDEAQKLTNDAQNAMLKLLEDTPRHVYFFLCTTDPQKLIPTIRTRATTLQVSPLKDNEMRGLLSTVCEKHDIEISEDVEDAIVENSEGSSRKALVFLNQVAGLDESKALETIEKSDVRAKAIELAQMLMFKRPTWKQVATLLNKLREQGDEQPEQIRWMMLGYASTTCLNAKNKKSASRAFVILDQFQSNYYDTKWAGLIADCFEVVHGRQND